MNATLTADQQYAIMEAMQILGYSHEQSIVIQGSAGTGKTYMIDHLLKSIVAERPYIRIACTAPTNKAVAVLKSKISKSLPVNFITTHSALKLKRKINTNTGEMEFVPSEQYPLGKYSVIVVDEASMIDSKLLEHLKKFAEKKTVIYVGDNKQINPVNETHSPIFSQDYPTITLTEIIRQAIDNPIIQLSNNLPILSEKVNNMNEEIGYLYTNNLPKIIHELAEVNGTSDLKYLAWTNDEVDKINRLVRTKIYTTPKKIEIGETIVFNTPFGDMYSTNEELKILSIEPITKSFEVHDKTVTLKYYLANGEIPIIHEDSEHTYKNAANNLKKLAIKKLISWATYYSFIERFANIKYNHALTVHKSQGSTYTNVIINLDDINKNRNLIEKERLLYTAVTRASNLLIIYKK